MENEGQAGPSDADIVVTGAAPSAPPATPEPSPPTEPSGEGETPTTTDTAEEAAAKQAKGKDRLQKRFSELTRTIYEERTAREAAERKAAELEARVQGGQPPATKPSGGDEAMPKLEDFDSYEEFATERARWVARTEMRAESQRQQSLRAQQAATERAISIRASWETAESEFKGKVGDYDEVLNDPSVKFTEATAMALLDSDLGPQVAYYLKKHPEEARALNSLSPVAAARAIGKLEVKLSASPPEKPKTSTPAPPSPVKPAAPADDLSDNLPIGEWIKRRNQAVLNRRK